MKKFIRILIMFIILLLSLIIGQVIIHYFPQLQFTAPWAVGFLDCGLLNYEWHKIENDIN